VRKEMGRELKNKSILVVGGAGFIGSHLVDRILGLKAKKVIIMDNMFLGDEQNLAEAIKKGAILYKDDAEILSSLEYIIEENGIEVVFNCATKALNYSFANPSNAYMTNVNIMINILELQRKGLFNTLCHFSTSEVYGTAVYEPMDEEHPLNPTTTYAAGKAAADLMINSYVKMFGVDAFIIRPFNNYGPRQNSKGNLAGVIPKTISKIFNDINPEIHGTGYQKRDFIYVEDTVSAVLDLFKKLKAGESVNISSNNIISIEEIVNGIAELMAYKGEIIYKEARNSDVELHSANNDKLNSLITFNPINFEVGLKRTIDWYINELNKAKDVIK
jgi:UDP-glucose 4-epimerase